LGPPLLNANARKGLRDSSVTRAQAAKVAVIPEVIPGHRYCGAVSGRGDGEHNHEGDHNRQHGRGVGWAAGRCRVALTLPAGTRD